MTVREGVEPFSTSAVEILDEKRAATAAGTLSSCAPERSAPKFVQMR